MKINKSIKYIFVSIAVLTLVACNPFRKPLSNDYYADGIEEFTNANKNLAKLSKKALLDYRTEHRIKLLRHLLILNVKEDVELNEFNFSDKQFICEASAGYAVQVAQQNFLAILGTSLDNLAKEPNDKLLKLIKVLGTDYLPEISNNIDELTIHQKTEKQCREDIELSEEYFTKLYPVNPPVPEFAVIAGATAAIGLYKVIKEIVVPILVSGLQEVDRQRRADAIEQFLRNKDNTSAIKSAVARLRNVLEGQGVRKRSVAILELNKAKSELIAFTKSSYSAKSNIDCNKMRNKSYLANTHPAKDSNFRMCIDAHWQAWKPLVKKLLVASEKYDLAMSSNLYVKDFDKFESSYEDLIKDASSEYTWDKAKNMFEVTVRIYKVSEQAVKAVSSDENRKKIEEKVDLLIEAFS